ncbi:deoxyribonuclease V [Pedobacter glucosidilyticus]|uniref:deoxyribonuclease V n=1 Tax=Pedobacter glucosidilyticus TaxID=1122941 RepID=UPI0026F13977|nr:deoxyribonuclease V [Pedobacter glucosidilyticus]
MIEPEKYQDLSPKEAIAYQKELRALINLEELKKPIRYIAGADISFNKYEETVYAGIVVLTYPDLIVVEEATAISSTTFPYVSGLLAFREIPALLEAFKKLKQWPDVMVLDGQGIAHERRLGIATHFGLLTDVPSIGSAKSRLHGLYEEPGDKPFSQSPLLSKQEIVGFALRSKTKCKPIFVSPGHKVSLAQSVEIMKNCITKYRIPEPTRLAHLLVNSIRLAHKNL